MGNVVILGLGFVLLVWGADRFVEGASGLAKKLGVSSIIIGLTIVAFGTSAPELAVSLVAGIQGVNEIAIGNVVGSNIFNLLIVVGCSAVVSPLIIDKELLKRDWIVMILSTILLMVILMTNIDIIRIEAMLLLIGFAIILGLQIRSGIQSKVQKKELESTSIQTSTKVLMSNGKVIFCIVVGLTAIIMGGQLVVNGATGIARSLHISETIIGLTIVSIGTSLPELVTSVVATRRGEKHIAIGNVIGSNLFNILFILGITALCSPITTQITAIYDVILLLIISILTFMIAKKGHFNRFIGTGMIVTYIAYAIWIVIR